MIVKASGRSALILATGLFVGFAAPSQATPGADKATASSRADSAARATAAHGKYVKRGSRHWKKYAHRKSSRAALKSPADKKTTDFADDDGDRSIMIPPSVANANAQLPSAEAPADGAKAMSTAISAKAATILQAAADKRAEAQPAAESQVVAADQLNDVDRALHESRPPTLALASAEAPAAPVAPAMARSNENSAWDQTSLIGKIFIGFGALLTMASAARMFMA